MLNADVTTAGTTGTDLLGLGQSKMAWLQARQQVLAQNIANSDTPGYAPRDLSPFQSALGAFDIAPAVTEPGHMAGLETAGSVSSTHTEQSIDGNQVSLDREMEKVAETNDQQHMVVNLYSKYMSMFQTALDK